MSAEARVLVVANKTAATPALIEAVRERAARGPATFTLLVPEHRPRPAQARRPRGSGRQPRPRRRSSSRCRCSRRAAGGPVEGMIGVPEPLAAIQDAINIHGFDELIISTLPQRVSQVAQARPALQGRRPRAPGHDRDRLQPRGARDGLIAWGAVSRLWIWMQVIIVICVIASLVIAIDQALNRRAAVRS